MSIPKETRLESYEAVRPTINSRQEIVLSILSECGNMTAQEIANELCRRGITPTNERNFAAPRLTELCEVGLVKPVGKKMNTKTRRNITVWAVVNGGGSNVTD
ncbi:MAG: DNA gyrase [Oscillospiraceae bacterium]|jgi:predicted HTH transcriptional regulator|nr:DNA gyrase [Oscillospiraceae bacterium]